MTHMRISTTSAIAAMALAAACASPEAPVPATSQSPQSSQKTELQRMAERFAPTELRVDVSSLPQADRDVLAKLVAAAKIIDALFLRQAWDGNEAMLAKLQADTSPEGQA